MKKIKYSKDLLEPIIKKSVSYKDLVSKVGLTYCNGSVSSLKKALKRYNLSDDHFKNHPNYKDFSKKKNSEIFCEDSKVAQETLRRRVLVEKLIFYKCSECGIDNFWRQKQMPLILDHINGINNDNRLENLRFLCPNCDSIQDTYKNRNKQGNKKIIKLKEKLIKKSESLEKKINFRQTIINQILESNIDFSKSGWGLELSKLLNWTPQYSVKFIKQFMVDFYKNCWKHKR